VSLTSSERLGVMRLDGDAQLEPSGIVIGFRRLALPLQRTMPERAAPILHKNSAQFSVNHTKTQKNSAKGENHLDPKTEIKYILQ